MNGIHLKTEGLIKNFGGLVATDNLNIDVRYGELHAVIGPNGAGKTTLIAQLTGAVQPDAGRVIFEDRDITGLSTPARSMLGLARSFQITSIFRDFSVLENVALAVQAHQSHSFKFWNNASRDKTLNDAARTALDVVGLTARADSLAATLSHGEQRELELAMALATKPRLLLLDEPMAGMGPEESAQLIETLNKLKEDHTILLVEHDMDAVFALADRITVLVYGRAIATDNPAAIRGNEDVRRAYLGDEEV